jgi:hypothetical protein
VGHAPVQFPLQKEGDDEPVDGDHAVGGLEMKSSASAPMSVMGASKQRCMFLKRQKISRIGCRRFRTGIFRTAGCGRRTPSPSSATSPPAVWRACFRL